MKNPHNSVIFIIDENRTYRHLIQECLKVFRNSQLFMFQNPDDCLQTKILKPDIIITEFKFSNGNKQGLSLLNVLKSNYPRSRVIFLSSYGNLESAIQAIKTGATDYILKSKFAFIKLLEKVNTAISVKEAVRRNIATSRLLVATAGILAMLIFGLVFIYTH